MWETSPTCMTEERCVLCKLGVLCDAQLRMQCTAAYVVHSAQLRM